MRSLLLSILALTLVPLTACNLYFSGGDDPDPCDYGGDWGGAGLSDPLPELSLRNPHSGECEYFGWGNPPYPCDSECGPCAGTDGSGPMNLPTPPPDSEGQDPSSEDREAPGAPQAPTPTWGYCESFCTGLQEEACLATGGCRGIYSDDLSGGAQFQECWQTDFSGPILVETCEGLDAYSCSLSDYCIATHAFDCGTTDGGGEQDVPGLSEPECGAGPFVACHNEPSAFGCFDDFECGEGYSCNFDEVCNPVPGDGNGDCDPSFPECGSPTQCVGACVPDVDPGECDGVVLCDALPPLCEAGSTPGIADGCWTGACIDLSLCPAVDCNLIAGESMCIARDDCSAYYVGVDCSCTPEGCDCSSWAYDSCSAN